MDITDEDIDTILNIELDYYDADSPSAPFLRRVFRLGWDNRVG